MKKMMTALTAFVILVALAAGSYAQANDCCSKGSSCCSGQSCCRR